ncbi:MAG: ABC transporter C-terminal domain-containing protein, partial [Bacteroidota bacterium]
KLEREQAALEKQIEKMEKNITVLEGRMASPEVAADFAQLSELQAEQQRVQAGIDLATEKWEQVLMELEELNESLG